MFRRLSFFGLLGALIYFWWITTISFVAPQSPILSGTPKTTTVSPSGSGIPDVGVTPAVTPPEPASPPTQLTEKRTTPLPDLPSPAHENASPTSNDDLTAEYVWTDINRRTYTMNGNEILFQRDTGDPPATLTVKVSQRRLTQVIDAFGVEESRTRFNYTDEADRRRKAAQRLAYYHSRGVTHSPSGARIPHYRMVVQNSVKDLQATALALLRIAHERGYRDLRAFYGLVATFVQSIKYEIPASTRTLSDGKVVMTGQFQLPLEALIRKRADCDTASSLFAALTGSFKDARVILVVGEQGFDHAFIGVRGVPKNGDHFIDVQGTKYILIEMTGRFPIGLIPPKNWRYIQRNMYRVIPLI